MGRIKAGWQLSKKAWGVVKANPGLTKLPITGGIFAFIAFLIFGAPGSALLSAEDASSAQLFGGGVLLAIGLYLAGFATFYYGVALAAAADMVFKGQEADTAAGKAVARSRMGAIAQWTVVVTIVSLIFSILRDKGGLAGNIVAGIGAAIWSLITFMAIPVIAFEGLGPMATIKRSSSMFKNKWGEQITGNIVIGGITGLIMVLGIFVAAIGVMVLVSGSTAAAVGGGGLLLLGVAFFIAGAVVGQAMRGVFGVAMYHYIVDEQLVGPFSQQELESAVKSKAGVGSPATI